MEGSLNTDTHLSKDFNKVLQGCMVQANMANLELNRYPHMINLNSYYSAIETFFINTFFLFSNLNYKLSADKEERLDLALQNTMFTIQQKIAEIKYDINKIPDLKDFNQINSLCRLAHMMIMFGLNKRNMLVRQSERDPKGIDSIGHWQEKAMFKKGGLKYSGGNYEQRTALQH